MTHTSRLCPACGHKNRIGVLICEECGQPLLLNSSTLTRRIKQSPETPEEGTPSETTRSSRFPKAAALALYIRNADKPVILLVAERLVFGRADPERPIKPDVDLTPYGALEHGVSRIHATIHRRVGLCGFIPTSN